MQGIGDLRFLLYIYSLEWFSKYQDVWWLYALPKSCQILKRGLGVH
jgi:hypothetical protein